MSRTLVVCWLTFFGCATSHVSSTTETEITDVEVIRPENAAAEAVVRAEVEAHRQMIDSCYTAEMLANPIRTLSEYEFQVDVYAGAKRAVVKLVRVSHPEQQMLTHCIRGALASIDFSPNHGRLVRLMLPIRSPTE